MLAAMIWSVVIVAYIGVRHVVATFDMNIHELQLVADHLASDECRQLVALLQTTDPGCSAGHGKVEAHTIPDIPCLDLLVSWDNTQGKDLSFHDISYCLEQIQRRDVADALAETVFNEKADTIQRTFLDNPFKQDISDNGIDRADVNSANNIANDKKSTADKQDTYVDVVAVVCVCVAVCAAVVTVACRQRLATCIPCCWLIGAAHSLHHWCCTRVIGYQHYQPVAHSDIDSV
jgi:hypothetical protein